jgi:hypothetical protein
MDINPFNLPTQNQFTGVVGHGGQHIVSPTPTSVDASIRQLNIVYAPEKDVSRTYQGVSVTISAHQIPAFDNRQFYIAILAGEQIEYEQFNDAVRSASPSVLR